MATITNVSNKRVLIVDSMAEIRNQLQMSLAALGFEKLHGVSSVREAMDRIAAMRYDIILCDYNLGEGTNGQQFLEYLRKNSILSSNCMFLIITAENSYENVLMAAESEPDDYLLKPFTAAQFLSRFERILSKRVMLEGIYLAHEKQDWRIVIEESDKIIALKNKHYIEACKFKAEALIAMGRSEEAIQVYSNILQIRDLPWAQLGLAKANAKLGNVDASEVITNNLIEANPHFFATYDFASDLLMQQNKAQDALDVLKKANEIFAGNLSRTRNLSALAMTNGDHGLAEIMMSNILKKHRHSPVRECTDFALLSRALTEQGKTKEALSTLKDAQSHFKDETSSMVIAASSIITHLKDGNTSAADAALKQVLSGDLRNVPADVASTVAEACFSAGKDDVGNGLLKQILQNNPDDMRLQTKVKMVCALAGKKPEESSALIQDSAKEIIKINNEGVRKAQAGEFNEAIALISDAAQRLPNNLNIISNAALIFAVSYANSGDQAQLKQCLELRQRVASKSPSHPKLPQIDSMLKKARAAA